jgi:hypothetical protein
MFTPRSEIWLAGLPAARAILFEVQTKRNETAGEAFLNS